MTLIDHADAMASAVLIRPGHPAWDRTRQAFNLLVDQRPDAIALPRTEREVAAVVRWAADLGLRVAAQCTGHNAGPLGPLDGAVLVNTGGLTGVEIDVAARRVRVGAATRWRDVVPQLSEHGLAALHGSSPDVGVVGYSLGGGMGWLARRHGLQCNHVTAIELVTADGDLVRADAVHEPDLFWALRGGGGNFGIVTAIEFTVFPVAELYAGLLLFDMSRATEVLRCWRDLLPGLPDTLTSWASLMHVPDLPFVPEPLRGRSVVIVSGVLLGDAAEGSELLAPLRALAPELDTFAMVPPAGIAELAMDPADPMPYRTTHHLVVTPDDATIDRAVSVMAQGPIVAGLQLRHAGGALGRVPAGAGARATLAGEVAMFAAAPIMDPAFEPAILAGLRELDEVFAPVAAGAYANFVEEPADASAFFAADAWERLREVKGLYDPADRFRGNHHIAPAV